MLRLTVISVILCFAAADNVVFKDCGSKGGTINSVDVTPCPTEPCQFPRNKNITVAITFTASESITSAKTKVYGYILGIKTPFPVPDDACQDMPCPVQSGTTVIYRNAVFVEPVYPQISLVVQWEIHDQNDATVLCFDVPAQIVSG
ncbi:NPC intracellular cholesterol transporter 2-like isoform X2 [Pomacea canaliculata]|uniref:NPC intracellular cholesterol transporter 2-like isoform X1 n=1 Tax=Pomacea canaliculata TaxID=400727 RepID=UPI000D736326|nr:NPC intracellular cholesterol transporter 2-like isoform X1 [Pomacea canaliculata]XP_025106056.1 NPC intracellular cholesterol transporter 2-like isoform X2 [Pomacea canaliculata]